MGWKFTEDKKRIIFDDYDLYVNAQDNRFKEVEQECHVKAHAQRNFKVITSLFNFAYKSEVRTALDIGPRSGISLEIFEALGVKAIGVDISPRVVEKAQREGKNIIEGDAHKLSEIFNEKFDCILSVHSLEHCYDPEKVLNECHKIMKLGGWIAICVPIQGDLTEQKIKNGIHGDLPAHFSGHTTESLKKLLFDTNFDVLYDHEENNEVIIIGRTI